MPNEQRTKTKLFKPLILIILLLCLFLVSIFIIKSASIKDFSIFLKKEKTTEDKNNNVKSDSSQDSELTKEEINKISKSIVALKCLSDDNDDGQGFQEDYGSGTLFSENILFEKNIENNFDNTFILTNSHVAPLKRISLKGYDLNYCDVNLSSNYLLGFYGYNGRTSFINGSFDIALLKYKNVDGLRNIQGKFDLDKNNEEQISILKSSVLENHKPCSKDLLVGGKVYVFGYPSSAFEYENSTISDKDLEKMKVSRDQLDDSPYVSDRNAIVSTGIISGISSDGNYYTDAKIDAGNSGGLAVSKISGQICIVGIPTWLSEGEYSNLGLIQPFENVINILKGIY